MFKWALILLPILAAGCQKTVETPSRTPVCIEATIAEAESRTSMSGSKASFTSGDRIGLFETYSGQSNISYSFNGTSWSATTTPAYWYSSTATHTFYAYYPYQASASGTKVAIPALSSQTAGTTPSPAADFLLAGPLPIIKGSSEALAFTHGFALLQFNVKLSGIIGLQPYNLNNVTVNGGNLSSSSSPYGIVNKANSASDLGYDLITKKLVYSDNDTRRFAQSVVCPLTGITVLSTFVTIYVFILPGTYSNPAPTVTFNLSLLGILLPKDSTPATLGNTTFAAAAKYTYDVTINKSILAPALEPTLVPREVVPID